MKFSPYGSSIPLVFAGNFHPEILTGFPIERGRQIRKGGGNKPFYSFKRTSKTVGDTSEVTIND